MSQLSLKHFKGITMKDLNNYIEAINDYLNVNIRKGVNWQSAVKILSDFLNEHDFIHHEGQAINDDTIDAFITRIENENKNDNSNFLPVNKLDQSMTQPQPVNPLQNLVENQIGVQDLLNIYNRYAPNPITLQQAQANSNGDVNVAKAYLINEILRHAHNGTLVARGGFGKPQDRKGMNELSRIILDLQRDVTRVKNAISPQGAEALVMKHNATAKPGSHWKLNKRDQNAPASLTNLTDVNNDGVPDVIITNGQNKPIFVNGYTTTSTTYPIDLAYYNQYPTRADRRGHSRNTFKNELYNVTYDLDNADIHQRGNVTGFNPRAEYLQGYDPNKFQLPQPKRMTSFARFKKFIASDYVNDALQRLRTPAAAKLAQSSKGASAAWNHFILEPIFEIYGATTPQQQARIKKSAAAEIDAAVDDLYLRLNQTGNGWTEEQRTQLNEEFMNTLFASMDDFEGAGFME